MQFSTRVDVLSKEFVKELEQLQDNVPGFGAAEAKRIVEEQLGAPLDEKFSYFEDQPIAAASLGQVCHRLNLFLVDCLRLCVVLVGRWDA